MCCLVFWSPFLSFSANCMLFSASPTHFLHCSTSLKHSQHHFLCRIFLTQHLWPSSFRSPISDQVAIVRSWSISHRSLRYFGARFASSAASFRPHMRPISSSGSEDMEGLVIESPFFVSERYLKIRSTSSFQLATQNTTPSWLSNVPKIVQIRPLIIEEYLCHCSPPHPPYSR